MMYQNDGTGESNILQNQFTAYLKKAIHHSKIQYLSKISLQKQYETSFEIQDNKTVFQSEFEYASWPIIDQLDNDTFRQILEHQKKDDLYIFFAKVLENKSFVKIASELELSYRVVTMRYYRMIEKIKNELTGG